MIDARALRLLAATALCLLASCHVLGEKRAVRESREYGGLGMSWDFRSGKSEPVEEGPAYHVHGGYVLFDGDDEKLFGLDARASVDLEVGFSRFDLDPPLALEDEADVWRFAGGGRLEWDLEDLPLTPYLRGGFYVRSHTDEKLDVGAYDQDGRGIYAGVGCLWWYEENLAVGPFVTFTRDVNTNNLRETFLGLSVMIRAPRD